MGGESTSQDLRQALIETLRQLQIADTAIRTQAEAKAKALEVTDEYAIHLCEIILDSTLDFASRQLGSVLLKQYVDVHWSIDAEQFILPECPAKTKEQVRTILPLGLKEPHNKLRATIAYAISTIAHYDWPERWAQLFNVLMQALKSNEPHAVDGAMRVLTEFSRDITESQMAVMAPVVLPEMYSLLTSPAATIKVKSRSIQIFSTCSAMLSSMAHVDKNIIKTHLSPALPNFMKAFVEILTVPTAQVFHPALKIEVLKCLTEVARNTPRSLQAFLGDILGPVWATLTETAAVYVKTQVNNTEDLDTDIDSDGEMYCLSTLIQSIFEFVQALVDSSKLQDPVHKGMDELLFYLIVYMQVTEEKMQGWLEDPDKFVEEEHEETFAYGVRISALEVLLALIAEFEDDCVLPMCSAVTRQLTEAAALRSANSPYWWKLHEASMFALQNMSGLLTSQFHSKKMPQQFDLSSMLETIVAEDMNLPGANTFLVGRCLCFASKFPSCMQQSVLQSYLSTTVTALQPSQPAVLRISAVKALYGFCDYLKSKRAGSVILPYLGPSIDGLLLMAEQATPEALSLVLEALTLVISIDADFTVMVEPKVTPLAIMVFLKYSNDNVLVSFSQDIFKELSKTPGCADQLLQRLLPMLIEILTSSNDKMPSSMHGVALDVLYTLVKYSKPPLCDALINQGFPACVAYVLSTDDITCMQNGGECLRAYVLNGYPQLVQWRNDAGQNGMHLVLQVCEHLMDPKAPESAAALVGRLVSTVVSRGMGDLGQEGIEMLLRSVLSKLLHTQTLSVAQNLILVFARLVHSDLPALLNFLSSVPGPSGESALAYVLTEWCSRQSSFFGNYDTKVTMLALAKLVEHALSENDERLLNITVKGDEIVDLNSIGSKTRSQTARNPVQWTEIPVVVKMYKLVLRELFQQSEEVWPDDDEETDSESEIESSSSGNVLDGLNPNVVNVFHGIQNGEYDDMEDDDPKKHNDPMNQIDLKKYLSEFVRNIIHLPCYSTFSQHHSPAEKTALAAMGFSV